MAAPRDFQAPVASFVVDVDAGDWEVVYKHGGRLWSGVQPHAPFDVVAWHGNLAPCKYALDRFVGVANTETDQADPTVYCVLTAKSKAAPGSSLIDFLAFQPRWSTTRNTFRPPYFHRNTAAELMGLAFGAWPGSGHALAPGGLSFEPPYMPHGESHARWVEATTRELGVERVGEGALAFMWHISAPVAFSDFGQPAFSFSTASSSVTTSAYFASKSNRFAL
ncbi:putative homogentisate -dioxygenase protein [Neofusicoccum parvum UCRNP2]|uniref:homogentisate 1,2-dioxygenase n=1 Tax=Botryosphaeria parva (strain UCR-NP2) TaxID=1287680 RepID=R1H3X0_BOTPV|nr:putative homogentisate -dioxygenase protein [Neofusicoccum parvum UCRNP2]